MLARLSRLWLWWIQFMLHHLMSVRSEPMIVINIIHAFCLTIWRDQSIVRGLAPIMLRRFNWKWPTRKTFQYHQCRQGYWGRHDFRDSILWSSTIKSSYLFSIKCIVLKVFLFQAVLEGRNGPGPSVQFTENGGVSTDQTVKLYQQFALSFLFIPREKSVGLIFTGSGNTFTHES